LIDARHNLKLLSRSGHTMLTANTRFVTAWLDFLGFAAPGTDSYRRGTNSKHPAHASTY
jgi:hypothetical protein